MHIGNIIISGTGTKGALLISPLNSLKSVVRGQLCWKALYFHYKQKEEVGTNR